jgi:beta-glucosidase
MLVNDGTDVLYVKGCNVLRTDLDEIDRASTVAENADVAIVVVGENERFAPDGTGTNGEHKDVASLDLTGLQQKLVQAVHATGTPTIVVLINGRPLSTRWIAENIPAVIEAWIPGEAGGLAVAEVLFGQFNPEGRLPITVPRHAGQLPVYYNYMPSKQQTMQRRGVGYVDMSITPLYPFGFGLSYSSFEYNDLAVTPQNGRKGSDFEISLDVTNTSGQTGAEVVQLYINDVVSSLTTPVRVLRRFEKVRLAPGETRRITFILAPEDLSFHNQYMERVVEPGTFDVMIGSSCDDIRLQGSFVVEE